MSPRSIAGLALFASLFAPLPAQGGGDPPLYPEAAGTTVVTWKGVTGITLMLPTAVRIRATDLDIEAEEGTLYVFAAFRSHSEPGPYCQFCLQNFTLFYPETRFPPVHSSCSDDDGKDVGCPYKAQPLELYLMSDGAATLTVRIDGLEGTSKLTATGQVDGTLEEIPVRGCYPLSDCSGSYSYGGLSRTIGLEGRPALGLVHGYLFTEGGESFNPGLVGLDVCAYPAWNDQSASGDPDRYPHGCAEPPVPGVTPGLVDAGAGTSDGNSSADGRQYLGFTLWNERLTQNATVRVWGLWLESGMVCPSGTFLDCLAGSPRGSDPS